MLKKTNYNIVRSTSVGIVVSLGFLIIACSGPSYSSSGSSYGPPYTVTYQNTTVNTTGGTPTDSTQYASGTTVTVLGNVATSPLVWTGFTFVGWNTMDNGGIDGGGGGTLYLPGSTFIITSNVTLYGTWH